MKSPKYIAITSGALLLNEFEQLMPILAGYNLEADLLRESKENFPMKVKTESARNTLFNQALIKTSILSINFFFKSAPSFQTKC